MVSPPSEYVCLSTSEINATSSISGQRGFPETGLQLSEMNCHRDLSTDRSSEAPLTRLCSWSPRTGPHVPSTPVLMGVTLALSLLGVPVGHLWGVPFPSPLRTLWGELLLLWGCYCQIRGLTR